MKDENEIDRIFDPAYNDTDLIKSAKRKSYFRISGVSFIVLTCALALLILLKIQLTPYFMNQKMMAKELYYEIYGANIYTGPWTENYKLVGSSATAPKYKLVNGKPVNLGDISLDSATIETTIGDSDIEQYSYLGNRVMAFFHPSLQYRKYANDLDELQKVDNGKVIEMALSFDQPYTYEQVVSMLPEGVTLQWNWVNTYSAEELDGLKMDNPVVLKEQEVAGFPSVSKSGGSIQDPVSSFITALESTQRIGGTYKEDFEHIYKSLKNGQTSLTNENITIIGAVVTGDKKQLATLINKDYITASSFGAIVDQY
ncbi:MAG: anti sigma factor C-terminal domain-containing protein [Bacillus sp. (in: firmicutes)]